MRDMPAGFQNTVLASSAAAAPPAKALPKPLPLCSCNAKPEPKVCPPANASAAPASAAATRVRLNGCDLICSLLLKWNDAFLLRFLGRPEQPASVAGQLYTRRDALRTGYPTRADSSGGSSRGLLSAPVATYVSEASVTLTQITFPGLRCA